jgi:hypothetical protein
MVEVRTAPEILILNLIEREHLGDVGMDGRITKNFWGGLIA